MDAPDPLLHGPVFLYYSAGLTIAAQAFLRVKAEEEGAVADWLEFLALGDKLEAASRSVGRRGHQNGSGAAGHDPLFGRSGRSHHHMSKELAKKEEIWTENSEKHQIGALVDIV